MPIPESINPVCLIALVRNISKQSAEGHDDFNDYLMHLDDRLSALAKACTIRELDLELLILDEVQSHCGAEYQRVSTTGPVVQVIPAARAILALGLHELTTNAVKYGALSAARGHVQISWLCLKIGGRDSLRICWKETGVALGAASPSHEGFGFRVLREWFNRGLEARTSIVFENDGLCLTSEMPWSMITTTGTECQ